MIETALLILAAVGILAARDLASRRELHELRKRDYYRRRQAEAGKLSGEKWRELRDTKTNQMRRELGL